MKGLMNFVCVVSRRCNPQRYRHRQSHNGDFQMKYEMADEVHELCKAQHRALVSAMDYWIPEQGLTSWEQSKRDDIADIISRFEELELNSRSY
jgi:hypothetical protein